jgi:hypothetical protein
MAESTMHNHVNGVLRLIIRRSALLASVRKDHELNQFLRKKQKARAEKPRRGAPDDPICHLFGDYVVVVGEKGLENLCRFRNTKPCPRCKRGDGKK